MVKNIHMKLNNEQIKDELLVKSENDITNWNINEVFHKERAEYYLF